MFLSLDGIDGSGKSTQHQLLCQWLREKGLDVVACRDPGSTGLGEAVRHIVLSDDAPAIHRRTEMLLYMAARTQLVEEIIRPALLAGKTVVADRFLLANVAYQAYGGGLPVDAVWQVGEIATGGIVPDLTLVLDLPAQKAFERIRRSPDRMERQGLPFLSRVREGYAFEVGRRPNMVLVDASDEVSAVQARLRSACEELLLGVAK